MPLLLLATGDRLENEVLMRTHDSVLLVFNILMTEADDDAGWEDWDEDDCLEQKLSDEIANTVNKYLL